MNGYKNLVFNGQRIQPNTNPSTSSQMNNQAVPIIGNSNVTSSLPPIISSSQIISNGFPINFIPVGPPHPAFPHLSTIPPNTNPMNPLGPPRITLPFSIVPSPQSSTISKKNDLSSGSANSSPNVTSNPNGRIGSVNSIGMPANGTADGSPRIPSDSPKKLTNPTSNTRSFVLSTSPSPNNSTRDKIADSDSSNNTNSVSSIKSMPVSNKSNATNPNSAITISSSTNTSTNNSDSISSSSTNSSSSRNSSKSVNEITISNSSSSSTSSGPTSSSSTENGNSGQGETLNRSSIPQKSSVPHLKSILGKRKSRTPKSRSSRMTINYINEIEDGERDPNDGSDTTDPSEIENIAPQSNSIEDESSIQKLNGNSITQNSKISTKNRGNSTSPSPSNPRRNGRTLPSINSSDSLDETNNEPNGTSSENMERENEEDISMRDLPDGENGTPSSSSKELNKLRKDATLLVDFYQDTISMNSLSSPSNMLPPSTPNAPSTPSIQSATPNQSSNSSNSINSSDTNGTSNSSVNTVNTNTPSNPNIINPANFIQYYYPLSNYQIQYSSYPYLPVPLPDSYKTQELLDTIGKKLELPEDMLEAAATKLLNQGFIIIAGLRNLTNWEKVC